LKVVDSLIVFRLATRASASEANEATLRFTRSSKYLLCAIQAEVLLLIADSSRSLILSGVLSFTGVAPD